MAAAPLDDTVDVVVPLVGGLEQTKVQRQADRVRAGVGDERDVVFGEEVIAHEPEKPVTVHDLFELVAHAGVAVDEVLEMEKPADASRPGGERRRRSAVTMRSPVDSQHRVSTLASRRVEG